MLADFRSGLRGRRVLLLQGPPGPFFWRFSRDLRALGAEVCKINLNAGDVLDYPAEAEVFREPSDTWPDYIDSFLAERDIGAVFLFGDCRPIHKAAIDSARARGVPVWVFEEGYLRPDFITLEPGGVNGYSRMPREPELFRHLGRALPPPPEPASVGSTFLRHAFYTARYGLALARGKRHFPHYRHHRSYDPRTHTLGWLRGGVMKPIHARREQALMPAFEGEMAKRYFLVPLQVHADYQILEHSPFLTVDEMITHVIDSFVAHAPDDTILVFKHHPLDRGNRDYGRSIALRSQALGLERRVLAVHDLHLPTLLKHARGVVTVNSTVGLSAVHHGVPVKVLGNAIYDIAGLTARGSLAQFWTEHPEPERELYQGFANYLRWTSQHNGNFYQPLASVATATGVRWLDAPPAVRAVLEEARAR
ncbi:capsule biosynthesis protein [Haliangium ochraceum]|uniref:Capsule polysaccharide biosynthesis protein n=1 Tax=Haliangium ochraceum (strain DSM 14365 / JCM 11303 / SMP-2) TaxID=502025 RepID=D0LJR5_HALO1|nr:capsular biosynthesis protein [Haliangium ochraceum]ACY18422.1 Capsule polysaccharide biosynthesis protein [Haliangium ochraceum DSM 14365]